LSGPVREDTGLTAGRASGLHGHRLRLVEGMTAAVARIGYPAVTIADVVAEAGVSKRTFYEHFDGKEDCLLAGYIDGSNEMMAAIRERLGAGASSGPELIQAVIETYLGFLDRAPQLAATLLIEVQYSGPQGRQVYRRTNREFAGLIRKSVAAGRPPAAGFDLDQAVALVGGVNELVLAHAEDYPAVPFSTLGPAVLRFARAVITGA
jgi:AcrR family transcriptional regulator